MRIAFISDIHGNLPALKVVLNSIAKANVSEIICLGDVIGYGPFPVECLTLVRQRCKHVLLGNHEHAILNGSQSFTQLARRAIDWTASRLKDRAIQDYLYSLEPQLKLDDHLCVHGSIQDPLMEYVREADSPWAFRQLQDTLKKDFGDTKLCFCGHNHRSFLATKLGYIFPHDQTPAGQMQFNIAGQKAYVSVGSVGQPRDGDVRASWVLFDGETVKWNRVPYDIQAAVNAYERVGLPKFLSKRLWLGV